MNWHRDKVNPDLLDDELVNDVCSNMDLDCGEDSAMQAIAGLSPYEILDRYLTWNGIIGYTHDILSKISSIEDAKILD